MEELTVVAGKQRNSEATWKERIVACCSSGQTVKEWCLVNGINSKSYYRWERKLLLEAGNERRCTQQAQLIQRFAEIPTVTCSTEVVAVLRTSEISCELHQGISPEQLSAIVQVMKRHA